MRHGGQDVFAKGVKRRVTFKKKELVSTVSGYWIKRSKECSFDFY